MTEKLALLHPEIALFVATCVVMVLGLSRNAAMMHIAKKAGMKVQYAYGEADAYLELPPADTVSRLTEALDEQMADLDYAVRRNLRDARRFGLRFWRSMVPQKHTA